MEVRPLTDSYGGYRARLLEELRQHGISDIAVLRAFANTPRHRFVPEAFGRRAYENVALPIGNGQTISQPSTQGRYLEALELKGKERVLEVGTGSGYQAALLSHLVGQVVSLERLPMLAAQARRTLASIGADETVTVLVGDGSLGWAPLAPYDAILVAAAAPAIPAPLTRQLADDGGRLVIPLQRGEVQELYRVIKQGGELSEECLGEAQFVPLKGKHGFPTDST
ncbi:MAG: protein-L-isoaspartate(D-aspartate) O-methyltransferase [Gemmatimonadota bacterium]|nr:MAG: protein-L-isoaspartate(D-aspartate) O-methyltransferase [Gemmatimonadota bacterium]